MKAIFTLILCVFYLLVATNTTINLHYCSGKIQAVSLFGTSEKTCCGEKMQSKGCCHNKLVVFKAKDNHSVSNGSKLLVKNSVIVFKSTIPVSIANSLEYVQSDLHFYKDESPPPILKTPIYIRNRSIII